MGFLTDLGPIQSFQESKKQQRNLKIIGVKQFLNQLKLYGTWNKAEGLQSIKWGEQIQGHLLQKNSEGQLQLFKQNVPEQYKKLSFPVSCEYGSWMFEIMPKQPYQTITNFQEIIDSLRQRYEILRHTSKIAITIPVIPFIGLRNYKSEKAFSNEITHSLYIDDEHITNHPRYKTITQSIRLRRGINVETHVPIYEDKNTDIKQVSRNQPKQGFMHMDAVAFGAGSCSLQSTFSTKNFDHARYIYDQLNVISPLFLALSAGTPFYKGKIGNWDLRWNVLSGIIDDRTESERDPNSKEYIPHSRYGPASYYIWNNPRNKPQYNDFNTGVREQDISFVEKVAEESKQKIDEKLIFHLANLFRRDYLIVHQNFKKLDEESSILLDMINGTNWNSVRLKAPVQKDSGWLVEFRTMEVQLTADNNAAFSLLVHLIVRYLHENQDLNLYIPITKLRENFDRAHCRNAVLTQKFYFRTNIYSDEEPEVQELTIAEIMFGKGDYKGIFNEIESKLASTMKGYANVSSLVGELKAFLWDLVTGKRKTLATWMRQYVDKHPEYTHNSILSKKVMDDLLLTLEKIANREIVDRNFQKVFSHNTLLQTNKNPEIEIERLPEVKLSSEFDKIDK